MPHAIRKGHIVNASYQAQQAYASTTSASLRTDRSTEYQAFSEIIRRLNRAARHQTAQFAELAAAIHDNRALWTILASDVASANNALPEALRAQIFYLAEFTDVHSRKVLRGDADVQALIDINTAVMRGLTTQRPAGTS